MTDTTPTRRQHDANTTTDRDVVSPTVAAQRLGITPDAVRARLRRGTIEGLRVDGDWQVFLPRDTTVSEDQHDSDTTETVGRHDSDTTSKPDRTEELIVAQREEIAFLRDQLDHSRRELSTERERFDIIHREALGRIEALTAGPSSMLDSDQAPEPNDDLAEAPADETRKTPESPQTHTTGSGATEAAKPSDGVEYRAFQGVALGARRSVDMDSTAMSNRGFTLMLVGIALLVLGVIVVAGIV